jgi:hypothetical protein
LEEMYEPLHTSLVSKKCDVLLAMTRADRTAGRVSKAGGNDSGVYASASANTFVAFASKLLGARH